MKENQILIGDSLHVLKGLESESIDCCVTSPPYWALRDYGVNGQMGLEESPEEYIKSMTKVFKEVFRVLKKNGTLWLNIGDTYMGSGFGWFNEENSYLQSTSKGTTLNRQRLREIKKTSSNTIKKRIWLASPG